MGRPRHERAAWAAFGILLTLFVSARTVPAWPEVFHESGQVRLLGVDSWFHARHAGYAAESFPGLVREDAMARYPAQGRQEVSGLFNLGIGWTARMLGADSVDAVAAWAPVFMAAGAYLLLFLIGWALAGPWVGAGACVVFLLFPGTSLARSTLGFADQHVLEFCLALGTAGGLTVAVSRALAGRKVWWWLSAPLALFFYSWLGAPIYLVPCALAVLTAMLIALPDSADRQAVGKACGVFFGSVAAIQLTVLLVWPDLVMALGRNTEWWILAGIVVLAAAPAVYFRLLPVPDGPRALVLHAALLVGVVSVLAMGLFVFTAKGQFFFNQLTSVRGLRVAEQGDVLWIDLWTRFGIPGLVAAASIPLVLWSTRDRYALAPRLMMLVFALTVFLIWLRTHDFDYAPPIMIALAAALGGHALAMRLSARLRPAVAGLVVAVVGLAPYGSLAPVWTSQAAAADMARHEDAWFDATDWLRNNSPDSEDYGVMTAWDDGNFVAHRSGRAVTLSRFPGKRDGLWLTGSDSASVAAICPQCAGDQEVRYAVVTADLASRLFAAKALTGGNAPALQIEGFWQFPGVQVPRYTYGEAYAASPVKRMVRDLGTGMDRYRLVYASPQRALLFTLYRPGSTNVKLDWLPVDSAEGRELLDRIANQAVVPVGDGYIYDLATVPQVAVFELVPPVGAAP